MCPVNFSDKSIWNAPTTDLNFTSVPIPGETNSLFQNLGLPTAPLYGSQQDVGKRICLKELELNPIAGSRYLNSAGQALYGGMYQLVLLDSGATVANVGPGKAAFFLDTATGGGAGSGAQTYSVTDESHAGNFKQIAGIFLFAATAGQYTFIQVSGKAVVQYRAAVTSAALTGAIIVAGLGTGVFDSVAAATAVVFGTAGAALGTYVGEAISVPANGAIGTVQLRSLFARY